VKLSDVMSAAGLTSWAEAALLLFFFAFLALVVWLLRSRRADWEHARHLPLEDSQEPPR
jgi:cbb3-type cytochrome oxidase subunit 3